MARTHTALYLAAAVALCCVQNGASQLGMPTGNLCAVLANCNGHGRCNTATKTCECFEGYGASTDVTMYRSPDCSQRVCPSGPSWGSAATGPTSAHAPAECSDAGMCDRSTGQCKCFNGFEGEACQRGHGKCMSMREMAMRLDAFPLSLTPKSYRGAEESTTWDQDRMFGCVCDSLWPVGLGAGQRQKSQWFGYDCSLMRCPSGDDPLTAEVETNCFDKAAEGGTDKGVPGNLCHVDCSNQGICDFTNGVCTCFEGFHGSNCASQVPIT